MAQVAEGGTFNFEVVARNKFGTRVTISDATVVLSDSTLGAVSVNPDGTNGVFTAATGVAGTEMLTPTASGVTGDPFSLPVVADNVVASVAIEEMPLTVSVDATATPAAASAPAPAASPAQPQ